MEKFPRGTLPPSAFVALSPGKPSTVKAAPTTIARAGSAGPRSGAEGGAEVDDRVADAAHAPRGTCDLASTCPTCGTLMQPEHAHYRCATCGYRDSCCF